MTPYDLYTTITFIYLLLDITKAMNMTIYDVSNMT